jgi:transcriptional regulator with XRE-family HTH domain
MPLTPAQLSASYLLAEGLTAAEVARRLKLARETVSRWKRLSAFQSAIAKAEREGVRLEELKNIALECAKSALTGEKPANFDADFALNILKIIMFERKA